MSLTRVSRILIDPAARHAELSGKIVAALPDVPRSLVGAAGITSPQNPRTLLLTVNRGRWIKPFHDGGADAWYLVFQTGCWYSCAYCYLRTYLEHPRLLTVFVNSGDMKAEVEQLVRSRSGKCSLYTGELADSLMLDEVTGFSGMFLQMARTLPVRRFEVRTKTDNIGYLVKQQPVKDFIVTFSLNPPELARYEAGTAPVEKRIAAMARCHKAGFRIGFHLDPLIRAAGWPEMYDRLLEHVFSRIPASAINHISYGALRFKRELTDQLREQGLLSRFPALVDEFFPGDDGKLRYYKPLRIDLLSGIKKRLAAYGITGKGMISMEPSYIRQAVLGPDIPG